MIELILAAVAFYSVYHYKKGSIVVSAIVAIATFYIVKFLLPYEMFSNNQSCANFHGVERYPLQQSPSLQYGPIAPIDNIAHPDFHQEPNQGDNTLTNLYRRLHNLDSIQRIEIFQNRGKIAGGNYGSSRQQLLGNAYARQMMDIKQQIRDKISADRLPYSEAYDVPTKPLIGDYDECVFGNCQEDADRDGLILGIPSIPGVVPAYY